MLNLQCKNKFCRLFLIFCRFLEISFLLYFTSTKSMQVRHLTKHQQEYMKANETQILYYCRIRFIRIVSYNITNLYLFCDTSFKIVPFTASICVSYYIIFCVRAYIYSVALYISRKYKLFASLATKHKVFRLEYKSNLECCRTLPHVYKFLVS